MMWPFGKKEKLPKLIFKGGEAFLEYQCKFGQTDIVPGQGIVAYVVDAVKEFGAPRAVKRHSDGRQSMMLKVASDDGGFFVPSYTATGKGDDLVPGDYVVWVPVKYEMPKIEEVDELDPRFGWVGFTVARVKAEIDPSSNQLTILSRYD